MKVLESRIRCSVRPEAKLPRPSNVGSFGGCNLGLPFSFHGQRDSTGVNRGSAPCCGTRGSRNFSASTSGERRGRASYQDHSHCLRACFLLQHHRIIVDTKKKYSVSGLTRMENPIDKIGQYLFIDDAKGRCVIRNLVDSRFRLRRTGHCFDAAVTPVAEYTAHSLPK